MKTCSQCKKDFSGRKGQKFCSHLCWSNNRIGISPKNINIIAGYWKGKKLSVKHKKAISISKSGKPTFTQTNGLLVNTGRTHFKKGVDSWNKGMQFPQFSGENHPIWVINRSELKRNADDNKQRKSSAYSYWSQCVKNRDGWKCKISNGDCSGRMEAHHILGWKEFPELRYETNNGITLCHAHHPRGRAEEKRLSPYFQELVSVSKETF